MKRITGIFLCVLTLLAFQVQAASLFSICVDPAANCCSAVESNCCDFAPTDCCIEDCCIEIPDKGSQFPLPASTDSIKAPLVGEMEIPDAPLVSAPPVDLFSPGFYGPDPPLPSGRILLMFVQSYLI